MPDYKAQLDAIFERVAEIIREKSDLDAEASRLTQLMHATANMLPAKERNEVVDKWTAMFQTQLTREGSLSDAVRKVFASTNFRERLTVAQVRDRLIASGYDFTAYLSNPLASVSATLGRLKDKGELLSDAVEGVAVYRRKVTRYPRTSTGKLSDLK
ncbi:MAG TPA: hypothetical protein VGD60_00180 [Candidatus Acidoferrales bacterium]